MGNDHGIIYYEKHWWHTSHDPYFGRWLMASAWSSDILHCSSKKKAPYTGVDSHSYFSDDASNLSGRSPERGSMPSQMDQSTSSQATDLSHKPSWLGQSHVQLLGHAVYILAGIASSSSVLDLILLSCAMRIYLRTGSWKPFNHICHLCVILCAHKRVRPTVAERSA